MRSLKDKVAIVTGASRGIGYATALLFAEHGARIVAAARSEDQLAALAREIGEKGGQVVTVRTDVTKVEDCNALARTALERYGSIDILVNNAGVGWVAPLTEHPLEQWHRVLDTDLNGVFYCTRAVLPSMMERNSGHIINISSVNGKRAGPNWGAYVPVKFALTGFSDMVQLEVKDHRIKVTTVYAGGVSNTFRSTFDPKWARRPTPPDAPPPDPYRSCTNEDIADCVVWCALCGLSPTAVPTEVTVTSWGLIR